MTGEFLEVESVLNSMLCTFYAQLQTLVRIRMSISLNSFLSLFPPKSVVCWLTEGI